jgi:hypothetical protein
VPVPTVRRLLVAVCLLGIPGMIVTSIADSTGGALAFGLATAAAVVGLILVTSVTAAPATGDLLAEAAAERVEAEVADLVAGGADEDAVRRVVRAAVRLGWVQGRTEGAAGGHGQPVAEPAERR